MGECDQLMQQGITESGKMAGSSDIDINTSASPDDVETLNRFLRIIT